MIWFYSQNQKRSSDFFRNVMSCRIELCEKARKNDNKNGIWNGHALSSSYAILFFRDIYWISLIKKGITEVTPFVHPQGFEPWTHWLRVSCSTNWAKSAKCKPFFVHPQGLEPWTHWLRVNCSTSWAKSANYKLFFFRTPSGIRTLDPLIKSQLLYQLS